jgi:hypothetical protein
MSLPNNQSLPKTCRMAAIGVALMIAVTAVGQSPGGKDIPTLARETSPSVVRIVIRDQAGGELGSGSGFVIGSDGRVVPTITSFTYRERHRRRPDSQMVPLIRSKAFSRPILTKTLLF